MKNEIKYQFRQRMQQVHKKNRRIEKPLGKEQIQVTSDWKIRVPADNDFLVRVGRDLEDYFFTSMNEEVTLTTKAVDDYVIEYVVDPSIEERCACYV
jgi:hypothetical protein